jgi:hypothetical protein
MECFPAWKREWGGGGLERGAWGHGYAVHRGPRGWLLCFCASATLRSCTLKRATVARPIDAKALRWSTLDPRTNRTAELNGNDDFLNAEHRPPHAGKTEIAEIPI